MTTTTTDRLSLSAALRRARTEVSIVVWDGQYAVNTYSGQYAAWVSGRPTWYDNARRRAKEEVATRALWLLAPEHSRLDIQDWVEQRSWRVPSAEALVRQGVRAFGLMG